MGSRRVLAGWAVLCLLLLSGPAPAATYFCGRDGSDQADGMSEKAAFATIGKGASVLKPGDTLIILPGVYREAVTARLSGRPDAPITIRGQRPGTVLLRGDADLSGFRRAEGMRYTYEAAFTRRVEGISERSTFRTYEPMLSLAEVEQTLASFLQDPTTGRLFVHCSDSGHPDHHNLSVSVTDGFGLLITPPAGSQRVSDIVIDGLSFTGYRSREYPSGPGSRARWGLHVVSGERVVVRRCTAFLNDGGIYLLAGRDCVVEDCYAFANQARFLDLGNNILGWSVNNTVFRRNRVEGFWKGSGSSNDDITFYGGGDGLKGVMEGNLAVNAGLMIKGGYGEDSIQKGNVVVGRGAYFYRKPDATNLLMPANASDAAMRTYADPINHDYRLQSDAPVRGTGPDKGDHGLHPYRDEVFFVSVGGNDDAAGTSLRQAWRTLARAVRDAKAGHTVYVTAGEYGEALAPAHSGTAENPVRFRRRGRDRVVLDGGGRLAAGIDLSGRSHVHVDGFEVRDFARHGVLAQDGEGVRVERSIVVGAGAEGVMAKGARGLVFSHNLVRGSGAAALRLEASPGALVTGNVLEAGGGPRLRCDAVSLDGLWSNQNAFPAAPGVEAAVAQSGDQAFASLEAWQKASGMDRESLGGDAAFREASPEWGDFALRPDSPLIGRGPNASAIGPWLRVPVPSPASVTDARVHRTTDTTAVIEWWTPTAAAPAALEWGETPACEGKTESPASVFHSVGLIGLKPATRYYFRVTCAAAAEGLLFASCAPEKRQQPATPAAEAQTFETLAKRPQPRVFHVATTGDDGRSGLSPGEAWRTLGHAAAQASAGDTVLIHGGTYEEYVFVRATGDEQAPVTFMAAPGETVWVEGVNRNRSTAFRLAARHHICLDGLHFRRFRYVPHGGDVVSIAGGSNHVVRRCFYDGREREGYMANFVRAIGASGLLIENCVMINGMGEGLVLHQCPGVVVRHCVFYNNFIRAMSIFLSSPKETATLSHNLFCDNIPSKTGNPLVRVSDLSSLRSDHNGYFTRVGPDRRGIVEAFAIGGKPVGAPGSGAYYGQKLLLKEVQEQAGQEAAAVFGNPGIRAAKELLPAGAQAAWMQTEMHWDGKAFGPLDFGDFIADPAGPLGRSAAGRPIGLDPAAFQ